MSHRVTVGPGRDLGAAKRGVDHWWQQRITACVLVLLSVWALWPVTAMTALDRDSLLVWVQAGINPLWLIALILVLARHSYLGTRVIVEDYARRPSLRLALVAGLQLVHLTLAGVGLYAILKIALGLAT